MQSYITFDGDDDDAKSAPVVDDDSRYLGLKIRPRDYQGACVDRAFELYDEGCRGVLARLFTGGGKTPVGSFIAHRWLARGPEYRVLVLCHERQLVHQFATELHDFLGIQPGIEMADERVYRSTMPRIVVASRATLYERETELEDGSVEKTSRLYNFDNKLNWLVIVDEAHRYKMSLASCTHIFHWFESNPNSWRLGLTATPERSDKVSLESLFPGIASDCRLVDIDGGWSAVSQGWAVPYDQRFVTVEGVDFKQLREVAGDFDEEQFGSLLTEREKLLSLVRPTLDLVENRRTLIFSPTVGVAKAVAHTINEFGRYACGCGSEQWEHVDEMRLQPKPCRKCGGVLSVGVSGELAKSLDGSFPDDARKSVYRDHQAGVFQFLSVCGLCREGYNDRKISAVAVFRPTKSRSLAEQMKGRGCRPWPGIVEGLSSPEERLAAIAASPKPRCMIIDLVGVTGLADVASTAHVFAEGMPDEVLERANENAMAKAVHGPVDMVEEIRKARDEIEEERAAEEEAKRKRREADERDRIAKAEQLRLEREEAARMRKILGDVRYSEHKVSHGNTFGGVTSKSGPRMPFGKKKGMLIGECSTGYLRGFLKIEQLQPWLRKAIESELQGRGIRDFHRPAVNAPTQSGPCTEKQASVLSRHGRPTNVSYAEAAALIQAINTELSSKRVPA